METPLQRILSEHGLTQGDVARGLGWDKGYVSKVVNGKTTPGVDKALELAAFIGVPVETLFNVESISAA